MEEKNHNQQNDSKQKAAQGQGQNKKPNQKNPNQQNKSGNKNPNKKRRGPPKFSAKLGNQQWELDIKEAIAANKLAHSRSLQSYNKINTNTDAKVKITPLGGLGEIGGNFMIMETNTSAIIIDIGMSFPSEDMHGVDILIPDFSYIKKIQDKIDGIVITHGHEDHIGAVAYFFKKYQFPIYATPLPLGMLSNKFDEHGLKKEKKFFKPVEKRKIYKIGDFDIEWMHVTHSIIDASSLAITTEAGTIIHTGDFKIDHTPIDGYPTDLHRFAHYGEKGVLCLLSDSTNSYRAGITKSESTVGPTFDNIFKNSKGRVIMSTFSSNIHRVYQAIEHGIKHNRKVDQIIISAKAIPGNEASVSRVLNYLIKAGAKVAYQDFSEIHTSGHAAIEEQKLMIRLCKPKFFLPVHGEYNHIHKHKQTAIACGVNPKNIYLMSDGDQVEVSPKFMKKVSTVKTGKTYIDNQMNKQIDDDIINDRQNLAEAGVVMIVAQIDKQTKKLISKPVVRTYGIVPDRRDKAFSKEMEDILDQFLINAKPEVLTDQRGIENGIRQVIRKHIFRQKKKYPTIVPTIFLM